jgi:LacI family transcriptional regulator
MIQNANVYDTARRLETDIRQRGLTAGSRYLTAAEAGRLLGVSTATAHRAMALLARRELLVRRRNSGTFVGASFGAPPKRRVRTLYAILRGSAGDPIEYPFDLFVQGVHRVLSGVNIQVSFLPVNERLEYLRELIESAGMAGEVAGFVPISCPREVYRILADTHLPMVIHGTAYLDQENIPSIDVDNREAGRLLTEYLVGRGHRRMALLCAADQLPGDNLFFDGTSEGLTAARLPHNALIVRSIPRDPEAFAVEIQRLLEADDPPTALIARTPTLGLDALRAVERLRAKIDVVCYAHRPMPETMFPYAHVVPQVPFVETIEQLTRMLDVQAQGLSLETKRAVIPVELRVPDRQGGR